MTIRTSKSKREIKFQNAGRPFSETGSRFISAAEWDISSKFGRQIDFHILNQIPSLNLNPEVHFRLYGRHIGKSIWRHNSAAYSPICRKFGKKDVKWHADDYTCQNRKMKWKSNMASVRFPKPEVVYLGHGLRYFIELWFGNRFLIH